MFKKNVIRAAYASVLCLSAFGGLASGQSLQADLSSSASGDITVSNSVTTGNVSFMSIGGSAGAAQSLGSAARSPEDAARNFMNQYGLWFGVTDSGELSVSSVDDGRTEKTRHVVKFTQTRNGHPVFASGAVIRLNSNLEVTGVNATLSSSPRGMRASVTERSAAGQALAVVERAYPLINPTSLSVTGPQTIVYNPALTGVDQDVEYLAYQFVVTDDRLVSETVFIDAMTGALLLNFTNHKHALDREIHDQASDHTLPLPSGNIIRSEGQGPSGIADADDAYDFSGDTYNFLLNEHGRDSLDGAGFKLISAVRFCPNASDCPYFNAFWNGQFMTYGAGLATDDVVAHELVHGFTEFTSNLIYLNQSGAINESLSDVWGEFVDQTNTAGNDSASVKWLMGEDIPGFPSGFRNMADPPAAGDPDKTSSSLYYCGTGDFGGVHSNSGVNNKAAFLMTDGGSFNGQTVNALGISKVADLYYQAQTSYLTSGSTYFDLYNSLIASCSDLGYSNADCNQVQAALLAVEMNGSVCGIEPPVPTPNFCPAGEAINHTYVSGFESGGYGGWTVNNMISTNAWPIETVTPFGGSYHVRGENKSSVTDSALERTTAITIPSSAYFAFDHIADLEAQSTAGNAYDGGVVEYSTNNGTTWSDLIVDHPSTGQLYNRVVNSGFSNPLGGRQAFSGLTSYRRTITDLSALSGSNVLFRFRIGTDTVVSKPGWSIDNVRVYQCGMPAPVKYCAGKIVTVDIGAGESPTPQADVILGTNNADFINASGGNDIVCGLGGNDIILGGGGYDRIYGQGGNDKIYGGNGTTDTSSDDMFGGGGNDTIYGLGGVDYIFGQSGADRLYGSHDGYGKIFGGDDSDRIYVGDAGDLVRAGNHNDQVLGSPSKDDISGGAGDDLIDGFGGDDILRGGFGNDTLRGGWGKDILFGEHGNDRLLGNGDDDLLRGGGANDELIGGGGTDQCYGGAGALDTIASCEVGAPITGVAAQQVHALPPVDFADDRLVVTDRMLELLDDCDLTLEECLSL